MGLFSSPPDLIAIGKRGRWMLSRAFSLIAAALGAVGTFLLFRGSFAFEAPAFYSSPQLMAEMVARNARRRRLQQWGLRLLMASFLLSAAAAVCP